MKYFKFTILIVIIGLSSIVLVNSAQADYYEEGVLLSTDLLSGISDEAWITGFTATSSVPASTTVGFLFSVDQINWYNSDGEEGIWDTMASGTASFNLEKLKWATSTLATSSLEFYYKARLTSNIATVTPIIYAVSVEYSDVYDYTEPDYGYYQEGVLLSTDLLSGISDEAWITGFTATSSVPASTTVGFLFSVDQINWYNSEGEEGIWDTMASGTASFNLEKLKWATSTLATSSLEFYYKARLTSDIATVTPIIYAVSVEYSDVYDYTEPDYGYYNQGIFVSENILATERVQNIEYFGYNFTSLSASTSAYIQFATSSGQWYSQAGVKWAMTSLAQGDHSATSSAIDLTGLNWINSDFYYKIYFETASSTLTPVLSETNIYFTELPPVEFTCIIDTDNGAGTDYTSLSAWEQAIQADLTAATNTLVFSYTTASGTIPDLATVVGETSGATATSTHMASSSNQILLTNISGIFQAGETIYIQGQLISNNYIISDDNGNSVIAVAKCRSTGGSADTTAVIIDGWTTSATKYIKIWTDPDDPYGRHNGKWDDNKYRIDTSSHGITIAEDYINIIGLQIEPNGDNGIVTDNNVSIIDSIININNNIIKWSGSSASSLYGIYFPYGKTIKIYNNIIYNINSTGINSASIGFNNSALTGYVYNNTTYNCLNGFYANSGTIISKNNIIQNCTTNFLGTFSNDSTNNISDDATHASSTTDIINTTVNFIDATNNDFHLHPDDISAKNAGTSLFFDSNLSFTDDIDGTARGGAWDIGADEVPVEYVSTICENTSAGGDCANMDYSHLGGTGNWEDKVECDLTANTTRVFSGTITGTLNENATVNLCNGSTDLNIDGVVVATTSDQILIDNITGATTPLVATNGWLWSDEACDSATNYWTISGTGDDLGASPIAVAMIDGAWSVADENAVTISDWITDSDNYIKVYTTNLARHQGKWDDGKYRIEPLNQDNSAISIYSKYIVFDGLQITLADNPNSWRYGIAFNSNSGQEAEVITIKNSIIKGKTNGNTGVGGINSGRKGPHKIYNNIIYDFDGILGGCIRGQVNNTSKIYIYNNTLFNCNRGINSAEPNDIIAINNLIASTTNPFLGTFDSASDYNATDIDNTPNGGGSNNATSSTFTFVDAANNDFHLAQTDVGAQSQGTDLSSDANLNFTTDIDGGTRIGSWDIGADQLSEKIYRSVGNDSSDLNTDSRTVTISGTTATFSDTMPDNIGVGDIIQYGGAGYYQIAIISNRSSNTEYTVQSYDLSSSLSATTTASANIYRAHLTLNDWETQILENVNSGISDDIDDYVLVGQDLTASNTIMMTACYASDNGDTEAVDIDGWTTGVDNYIKIYTPKYSNEVGASQRHDGKWDEGKYYINNNEEGQQILEISVSNTTIDGLQLSEEGDNGIYDFGGIKIGNYDNIYISNNIIRNISDGTGVQKNGINFYNYVDHTVSGNIFNNIVYNYKTGIVVQGSLNINIFNNTLYNNSVYGYFSYYEAYQPVLKNNIAQNCGDGFKSQNDVWNSSNENNLSDQVSDAPGANSINSATVNFIDPTNNDFHLSPTDTSAIDAGVNLSTSTDLSFTDDIDGNYRRQWDIGADEASVYFDSTIMESGGEFSSLSAWETANQVDLTATTTATFSIASSTGWIPVGSSVTGATSGATASTTVVATSSNKILLYNISGTFISGEDVQLDGVTSNAVELSNAGNPAIAVAKIDGAWSIADETAVTIDGWTTGKYNYIKVYTTESARHNGKWDEGKYRIHTTGRFVGYTPITINDDFVFIEGLQLDSAYDGQSGTDYQNGICISNTGASISNNIIKKFNTGQQIGIYFSNIPNGGSVKIYNNIIYDFYRGIHSEHRYDSVVQGGAIYNNTIYNSGVNGISARFNTGNGNIALRNNLVQGSADSDYYITNFNITSNNISEDTTSPDGASYQNLAVNFIDATNNDFHLSPLDTSAKNAGTNLSSDSNLSFTDDIDGTARGGAWDIGADEVPVEYVSTICENTSAGGDCANMDYSHLGGTGNWEDKVECDLTANTTRVFSGTITGTLNENATVNLCNGSTDLNIDGVVVATTSDQILIDNITGATTPLVATNGWLWSDEACDSATNYWTISGIGDDLGASPIAVAMIDGDWGVAETGSGDGVVDIMGWETDSDNYVKIYTTNLARHNGKWDDTAYRISVTNTSSDGIPGVINREKYVRIDGLQIDYNHNSTSIYGYAIRLTAGDAITIDAEIHVSNNIVRGNILNGHARGIVVLDSLPVTKIWNNVVYGFNLDGTCINVDGNRSYAYNNTVSDCSIGIQQGAYSPVIKNNIAQNCINGFYGTFHASSDYNISDISGDAPNTGGSGNDNTISPWYSGATASTSVFIDPNNYDFHLKSDSIFKDIGVNLSSDQYLNFTTDIDNGARIGSWDIGADQLAEKIYRSVGNDSSDLNTDSRTVTISGTTATFSDTMPDNIGVGDIIQYGGAGYYQIAIISNRSSNTEYTVQSYDLSSSLSATTTASANIYRAHLTLNDWETQILENVNSGISDDIDDYVLVGQDLVASNIIMMTACYASDNGDTEMVSISGWITGVDNYIKVYTPVDFDEVGITQRHSGKWDDGKYRLERDADGMWINEDYVYIDGLQFQLTENASTKNLLRTGDLSLSNKISVSNCIFKGILLGDSNHYALYFSDSDGTYYVWNNIIYDFDINSSYGINCAGAGGVYYIYNNTLVNCDIGLRGRAGTRAKNNIVQDCTTGFSGIFNSNSTNNLSDDATYASSTADILNTEVAFVDEVNNDFHLSPTDTSAIDAGVNLSTSTDLSFSDDIDGNIRRQWDIGADEASVYFDSTVMESGGEFSSLSAWETANQVDLTATTTATFSIASSTGWIPVGSSVTGATSGATASTTVTATSSNKILLYNISGTFISGEDVQLDGATSNAVELSNAGNPAIAVAKIDGAWSIADETAVEINGWTTGEYNYIKVYTTESARHNGKWDEGKYRIEHTTSATYDYALSINERYVRIIGLQIYVNYGHDNTRAIIFGNPNGDLNNESYVGYNIIKGNATADSISGMGIRPAWQDNKVKIYNNIVYNFIDNNNSNGVCIGVNGLSHSTNQIFYNNTVYGCYRGFTDGMYHGGVLKNNISYNNTDNYNGTFDEKCDYNLSGPIQSDAPGSNSINNITVNFIDATNNDFHLSPLDTSAKNAGTNLSSDSNLPFTDDIDGNTRYDVAWDIGADETTTILYRSVGNNTNDLNINTATTTISITTAEFSIDMPAKIGVGDVLQYGFPLQLGFITARISSTTYEIQNRIGALPTATTSASVSIFRAHEFLDDWENQVVEDVNDGIDASMDDLVLINNMDLTASNTAMFVPCYASTSADNLAVEINDWTTATSNYIKIYTPVSFLEVGESQRHSGIWDDEKYMLNISNDTCFNIQEPYTEIEGLQLTTSGTDVALTTYYSSAADYVKIYYNILKSTSVSTGNGMEFGPDRTSFEIYNNIVYDFPDSCIEAQDFGYVYNNTVMNCDVGFLGMWTANAILKNNVAFNNVDDFSSSFDILDYNASDDLDGTNAIDISPCPVEADCWKGMFMDYENYDFRIKNANSVLYNSGTAISSVTDDILGIARPQHGIYDVGAFEYSNSTPKYKFKGGKFKLKGKFEFK